MSNQKRTFKVKLANDQKGSGRYRGNAPYQAAKKAFNKIIKKRIEDKKPLNTTIPFVLIETTIGSKHGEYSYYGKAIKLKEPKEYKAKKKDKITKKVIAINKLIKYFKNDIRKVKKCDLDNFDLCEK